MPDGGAAEPQGAPDGQPPLSVPPVAAPAPGASPPPTPAVDPVGVVGRAGVTEPGPGVNESVTATVSKGRLITLWTALSGLGAWFRKPLVLVGCIVLAVLMFIMLVVQPFERDPPIRDIASTWNEEIGKLGMIPVYPPEEDVYVGDIWAVIDGQGNDPVLGTAVRVGHVDLVCEILNIHDERAVHFVDETPAAVAAGTATGAARSPRCRDSALPATTGGLVTLALVAFPGVTVSHTRAASAAFAHRWFGLGAENDADTTDSISIPVAFTYGVDVLTAATALKTWCESPDTGKWCKDAPLRQILASMGIWKAEQTSQDGSHFLYNIQVRLINRTYLAKSFTEKSDRGVSRGAAAIATPPDGTATTERGAASPPATTLADRIRAESMNGSKGGSASLVFTSGTDIALQQTFDRPLVFGYRAAMTELTQSTPKAENQ